MLKVLQLLLIMMCFSLQSCQHKTVKDDQPTGQKVDLSKAASYNLQLGLGYLKQGDRPRAKKKLLLALNQAPESADVNAAMAYYFEQTSELEQAKKYYSKALSLSSNSGSQLNNYGTFLCRQGEYAKAEQYFLKAVKDVQYVNTAGAYENAGLCALEIPDTAKAKLYFSNALDQDPTRKVSLYELAKLETKAEKNNDALELLQKHADLVMNDKVLLSLAKDVATKAGKYNIAQEYETSFKKAELNSDNSGVNNEHSSNYG